MKIDGLNKRPAIKGNKKLHNLYDQFYQLIQELQQKEFSPDVTEKINREIRYLNTLEDSTPTLQMMILKAQSRIIRLAEKEVNLIPPNHYRNYWMSAGMGAIGLPIGVGIALITRNMGIVAIGIPIGMVIGKLIGISKDKKAFEEGRQLTTEIKYQ